MPNNAFERTVGHRGGPALTLNGVSARAELAPCPPAQLGR
jgi:hypothetical protein